jgi:hypothetical protein
MATVSTPISRHVRATRTAISPRFAIRILPNIARDDIRYAGRAPAPVHSGIMPTEGVSAGSKADVRPVVPAMRALFGVSSVLVLIAGIQLFILSSRTDRFFAWTIAVPLTAAVDGAFYLASFVLLVLAARARAWAEVRPLAWGVLVVSTLKLVATLLHTSLFHFADPDLAPRVAAWVWLAVYIAEPLVLGALILIELRTPGRDPPITRSMPLALQKVAGVLAFVLLLLGLALLLAPTAMRARWPWPLTTLTAQAIAAWFAAMGVLVGLSARDGDVVRSRNLCIGELLLCVLQGIALARYSDAFDWGSMAGVLYVALFAWIGGLGAWGLIVSRTPDRV